MPQISEIGYRFDYLKSLAGRAISLNILDKPENTQTEVRGKKGALSYFAGPISSEMVDRPDSMVARLLQAGDFGKGMALIAACTFTDSVPAYPLFKIGEWATQNIQGGPLDKIAATAGALLAVKFVLNVGSHALVDKINGGPRPF